MTGDNSTAQEPDEAGPRWQPIGAVDRRVAGVMVEKAKTTPNAYPMSLNAICTACNQKNNRDPIMQLEPEDVEQALQRLRDLGAAGMIEGYGRVAKYRHYLYEWLGLDKAELAVVAELLLRGPQTEGELRGRAARMEPIRDLAELRPILASLKSKGLAIPLTPEGRGHVVTHGLYEADELEEIKAQYGRAQPAAARPRAPATLTPAPPAPAPKPAPAIPPEAVERLRREIDELRGQLSQFRADLEDLTAKQSRTDDEVRELRDTLGG